MPDILIAPQRGTSNNPQIFFTGSVQTSASIRMEVLPEGQIAFLGKSGSLFSISDSMVGSLMAVSDISGLPILEVFSDDKVVMGKYNSNALVVTGSSVSIGKSVPNAKLDVTGSAVITGSLGVTGTTTVSGVSATGVINTSSTEALRINNSSGYISIYNTAGTTRTGYLQGNTANGIVLAAENSSTLQFNVAGSEKVRIDVNGNVGIGTAAPRAALDVTGNIIQSWANNQLNVAQYLTGTQYKMGLESDSNNRVLYIQNQDADNVPTRASIQFRTGSTPSTVVTIQQNGNVGIGASSPTAKLQVNGDVMADNVFNPFLLMGA